MEQITIQVKDKRKARALMDFLQTLDFVETVASDAPRTTKKGRQAKSRDFFTLAGVWADRDVSAETLRKKAWPGRT
ncbi:MAG: hypothetical protein WCE68_17390 [Anaerolineales bacterium]